MSFVRSKFSTLFESSHRTASASNAKEYRDWLIQLIQSGIVDEDAVAAVNARYVAEHPCQRECIDSYQTLDNVMLPNGMSEAIAGQLIDGSVLLPEVNCVTLPFYSPLSMDDCYVSVRWGHDEARAEKDQLGNLVVFNEIPLKLTVEKTTLIESLRSEDYSPLVQSLDFREIGAIVDSGILSRCLEFASTDTNERVAKIDKPDTRAKTIDVSGLDFANPSFWEEIVFPRTAITTSNRMLVLGSTTATDLLSIRCGEGSPMVKYDKYDNIYRLKSNRMLSVSGTALPDFGHAERGNCFGVLADLSSVTANFQVGMPLYLLPHSIGRMTSPYRVDIVLQCDCQVMCTNEWTFLRKA